MITVNCNYCSTEKALGCGGAGGVAGVLTVGLTSSSHTSVLCAAASCGVGVAGCAGGCLLHAASEWLCHYFCTTSKNEDPDTNHDPYSAPEPGRMLHELATTVPAGSSIEPAAVGVPVVGVPVLEGNGLEQAAVGVPVLEGNGLEQALINSYDHIFA